MSDPSPRTESRPLGNAGVKEPVLVWWVGVVFSWDAVVSDGFSLRRCPSLYGVVVPGVESVFLGSYHHQLGREWLSFFLLCCYLL